MCLAILPTCVHTLIIVPRYYAARFVLWCTDVAAALPPVWLLQDYCLPLPPYSTIAIAFSVAAAFAERFFACCAAVQCVLGLTLRADLQRTFELYPVPACLLLRHYGSTTWNYAGGAVSLYPGSSVVTGALCAVHVDRPGRAIRTFRATQIDAAISQTWT